MSESTQCAACGEQLAPQNKFCPGCGASRDGASDAATVPSVESIDRLTTNRLSDATTGEFDILERIGHGAMGSVYLARDVALSRRVAIKVISPQLLQDESMIARFRLEAQTVASLRHPHIVNLHAVRELGDLHFFVMDYIDGPSLRGLMKQHGPLDIAVAQALLFQVGSALSYAHRRGAGVIHRDIKPANIMVDREGQAIVMDFGISKVGATQSGLTQTGATIGTPEYMSPEQCMDKELSGASDQYALGIVAYEMLTGAVPFKGSTYGIMMAHVEGTPPSIVEARPDCPPEVAEAVMRMIAKEASDRFEDVEEAVTALGGAPIGSRDPVRAAIVSLVGSVFGTGGDDLDASSPLSPVSSAGAGAAVPPAPTDATVLTDPPTPVPTPSTPPPATVLDSGPAAADSGATVADAPPPAGPPTTEEGGVATKAATPSRRTWIGVAAGAVLLFGLWQMGTFGGASVDEPGAQVAGPQQPPPSQPEVAAIDSGATEPPPESTDVASNEPEPPPSEPSTGTPTRDTPVQDTPPSDAGPTRPALDLQEPLIPDRPAVSTVRIVGGAPAMRVGTSVPISASALTAAGDPVENPIVQWTSDAGRVASVDGSNLVANGAGETVITATVEGVTAALQVSVLALPTREASVEAIGQFMEAFRRGQADRVERMLAGRGTAQQRQAVMQRMRQPSFEAQLAELGEIAPDGDGARVDFGVDVRWRDERGQRMNAQVPFRAALEPTVGGWRLAGVTRVNRRP